MIKNDVMPDKLNFKCSRQGNLLLIYSFHISFQDIKARRNRRMASRNRPRPSTKNLEQQSIKRIQMKTIAGASVDVPSEVIELKEQKAIQPPPPSIAVNESRYLYSYLYNVCTRLEIEKQSILAFMDTTVYMAFCCVFDLLSANSKNHWFAAGKQTANSKKYSL